MQKLGLLFLRSRSQWGLMWSKCDCFYCCIFWTNDSFATKLSLIADHHKPKCLMKILDCCVQGQGQSKCSKLLIVCPDIFWAFESFISKLGMVVHCHSLECLVKFKIRKMGLLSSGSRAQLGLMCLECRCFYYIFWNFDHFATKCCFKVIPSFV